MRLPIATAIIGVAAGTVGEVAPLYLPDTPQWVWGLVFWLGIATIAGALVWVVWPYRSSFALGSLMGRLFDFLPTIKFTRRISRMPIIELRDLAKEKYGWDFETGLHALDLMHGLAQVGLDGEVRFWGRKDDSIFEDLLDSARLEEIPKMHWRDFEFSGTEFLQADNNLDIKSRDGENSDEKGFVDIHIERGPAIRWLRRDADSYKGRTK